MAYSKGQWNVICDVCGWEFKSSEVKKRWDGLVVCDADWETDHPQKYIQVRSDPQPVPAEFIRSEPEDEFVVVCTVITNQGISGVGLSGCMISGKVRDPNMSI